MGFTEKDDKKHIPLNVLEDLIKDDKKLLQKYFLSLVRHNMGH